MKKAYILTFFYGTNYGSKLQATALGKYLEGIGYDVTFIRTFLDMKFILRHPTLLYTRIQNRLHIKEVNAFFEPERYEISAERQQRIDEYNAKHLKYITVKSDRQWKDILEEHPVFITGSDIVWQPAIGYPEKYFLDFAYYTDCKRISYATSVGAKTLPKKYTRYYKKYLGSYDAISVRENASRKLFEPIINKKITKVVDPTLLVSRDVWDELSEQAQIPDSLSGQRYILCYFVMMDSRYWDYVRLAEAQTHLKVVVLPMHAQDEQSGYSFIPNGTPYEFIRLIRDAEFIITDSFHASVFSFLYEKEVYILRRKRQDEDEKFNNILTNYRMHACAVEDETRFERRTRIDYTLGKARLEEDREQSKSFLRDTLTNEI